MPPKRKSSSEATTSKKASRVSKRKSKSQQPKPTTTATNINSLSFDCFFLVFRRFPLRTLLPLRLVCHAWANHIAQICSRKECLTLIPYSGPGPHWENLQDLHWTDDLKRYVANRTENRHDCIEFKVERLNEISLDVLRGLFQLFDGVNEIRVHYDCELQSDQAKLMAILLRSIPSNSLKSFQFWLPTNQKWIFLDTTFIPALYKVFNELLTSNRFPALVQLDVCVVYDRYYLNRIWTVNYLDFGMNNTNNILRQLKRFSLDCYVSNTTVLSILEKLGPQLAYLSIGCELYHPEPPISLLDSVRFDALTHLRLDNLPTGVSWLEMFCDRFRGSLQSVQLKLSDSRVYGKVFDFKWFEQLLKLNRLTELRLHNFELYDKFPDSPSTPSPSLPSVTKLTLCSSILLHQYHCDDDDSDEFDSELLCRTLAAQFPRLEELLIVCITSWFWPDNLLGELEQQIRQNLQRCNLVRLRRCVLDLNAMEFSRVPF